jgi:YYY domain-containing protein
MALPFTAAALLVALGVALGRRWPADAEIAPAEPALPAEASQAGVDPAGTLFRPVPGWRAVLKAIPWGLTLERVSLVGLAALVTGVLYPLNTWDFPTYVLVVAAAFVLLEALQPAVAAADGSGAPVRYTWRLSFAALRRAGLWTVGTVIAGRLLFWPYFAHYAQPNSGFDRWTETATRPGQYLIIHGLMLFILVSFLLAEVGSTLPDRLPWPVLRPLGFRWSYAVLSSEERRLDASLALGARPLPIPAAPVVFMGTAVLVALALWRGQLLLLLATVLGLAALVAWHRRDDPARLVLCGMIALAMLISAAIERYTLRGDIGRMNTVFKFSLQVWVLLALAAAAGLIILVTRQRSLVAWPGRLAWGTIAGVLVLAALTYPVMATPARLNDRFTPLPRTLDGMAYMPWATYTDQPDGRPAQTYSLAADYEAIRWLQDNVHGSPVILEGVTPLYRWGSRISVYTGLPTVIGWDWHQTQQRAGYGVLIDKRKQDVEQMLGSRATFDEIRPLLDKYHVRYIYIGPLERTYYDAAALRKFDRAAAEGKLRIVYQASGVTIFEYNGAPA